MAYSLERERPVGAAFALNPLVLFAGWMQRARKARIQRLALTDLLECDARMLDDLGLQHYDVVEALHASRPSSILDNRRAQRSASWRQS